MGRTDGARGAQDGSRGVALGGKAGAGALLGLDSHTVTLDFCFTQGEGDITEGFRTGVSAPTVQMGTLRPRAVEGLWRPRGGSGL